MKEYRSGTEMWVMRLIIIHGIFYLIQMFSGPRIGQALIYFLGLSPAMIVQHGFVWQIITYIFPHGGFLHLFLNMYALLIFGLPIEQAWGSKKFLIYYFFTGVGAGITIFIINYFIISGDAAYIPTIGASGAVFGLLLAFGVLFPDAQLLLFFVLPIRAKYLVFLYGAFEFYALVSSGGGSGISHVGHLGGIVFGFLYFFFFGKSRQGLQAKHFKTKLKEEIKKREAQIRPFPRTDNTLLDILKKVKARGIESLTDDEHQQIQYKMIMLDDADGLCIDDDFNYDDDYCQKCENIEACILRELKKYLK